MHTDGTYVGRSAPEIDVFEAQVGGDTPTGEVSQSAQWAVSLVIPPRMRRYLSLLLSAIQPRVPLG